MEKLPARMTLNTLSMDILLEIFKHLSLEDLLSVTEACPHSFRTQLCDPHTKSMWKRAREDKVYLMPNPPAGLSELRWATLLLRPVCESCGEKTSYQVDWKLRKRVCNPCKLRNLVVIPYDGDSDGDSEHPKTVVVGGVFAGYDF